MFYYSPSFSPLSPNIIYWCLFLMGVQFVNKLEIAAIFMLNLHIQEYIHLFKFLLCSLMILKFSLYNSCSHLFFSKVYLFSLAA